MSAPQLHRAARVLYQTPLARYIEGYAKREDARSTHEQQNSQSKSPYLLSCPSCSEIWVPSVTCRVRVSHTKVVSKTHCQSAQNKNKRSRKRAMKLRAKKNARLENILKMKKGDKYRNADVQYLHFECLACHGKSTLSLFNIKKSVNSRIGTRSDPHTRPDSSLLRNGNGRSTKDSSPARLPPAMSASRGLSLADFML